MRSKLLLLIGLITGYVLGARAGRQRYVQIRDAAQKFWGNPKVVTARHDAAAYAREQAPVVRAKVESVAKATPGVLADGARATADAAREVADKSAEIARDVADKTSTTAKDVADLVTGTAGDVKDRVSTTAHDLKERGEDARDRAVLKASEVRDNALATIGDDDEDDFEDLESDEEIESDLDPADAIEAPSHSPDNKTAS
ncbi:MAG TPA: protoporphyrinogen oxidase [Glaciihabitans sp.]|jgi:hypothetical protein|nr:protoporphyrinogen oxidase [Glaciihabitans sp.]